MNSATTPMRQRQRDNLVAVKLILRHQRDDGDAQPRVTSRRQRDDTEEPSRQCPSVSVAMSRHQRAEQAKTFFCVFPLWWNTDRFLCISSSRPRALGNFFVGVLAAAKQEPELGRIWQLRRI